MMENENDLASRIRTAIENSGKSQNQVADEAGITRATMSRYASGKRIPKATTMIDLAKALNTSIEWLQTGSMPFDTHIEMIIDYTTDGTDYQYHDNKGMMIRCGECKYANKLMRSCPYVNFELTKYDYCSRAAKI